MARHFRIYIFLLLSCATLISCDDLLRLTPTASSPPTPNLVEKNDPISSSRVYFQQIFTSKTSHSDDAQGSHSSPDTIDVIATTEFPNSIQAVNKSLEDAALKTSESRLLGYEPETWNSRYSPPIPMDVLSDDADADADDGDGDSDERSDDDRSDDEENDEGDDSADDDGDGENHNRQSRDANEEDDAPEQDGEVTEEYNDENAQRVIDDIDGDIQGQEGRRSGDDEFSFAASEQRPVISRAKADKPKRCKTVYREINGFSPRPESAGSKLLSDDDDFEMRWRRKRRSVPVAGHDSRSGEKNQKEVVGEAKSSSYMITRECTFDDDESVHEPEVAPIQKSQSQKKVFNSPEKSSLSAGPSQRSSRSESRFVPIFGWKRKKKFLTEPVYYDPLINDYEILPDSSFSPFLPDTVSNDFSTNSRDFWVQPSAQPWNDWNRSPTSSNSPRPRRFRRPRRPLRESSSHRNKDAVDEGDSDDDSAGQSSDASWAPHSSYSPDGRSPPYESYFEWHPRKASRINSDHGKHHDDGETESSNEEHGDETEGDSGDDEEETEMNNSPAEHYSGNVRRMFTQHTRRRRDISSALLQDQLSQADFGWTQPANGATLKLQQDSTASSPFSWNYFEQKHPNTPSHSSHSDGGDEQNGDENGESYERKPVHEEGEESSESESSDDDSGEGENADGDAEDESHSDDSSSSDDDGGGEETDADDESSAASTAHHDPENYANNYGGGNYQEYNVDYDSDRGANGGNAFNKNDHQQHSNNDEGIEYDNF